MLKIAAHQNGHMTETVGETDRTLNLLLDGRQAALEAFPEPTAPPNNSRSSLHPDTQLKV